VRTDFFKEEHIENNLAQLDSLLPATDPDYLQIVLLVKIYNTLQEIKEELVGLSEKSL
jgi:hypothetical protein